MKIIKKVKRIKKTIKIVKTGGKVLGTAALAALPVYMLAPAKPSERQRAQFSGRNYAHRGLHSEDKRVPENSLAAFELAASKGYGIELDVRLTRDGEVVVFHDDTLKRVCGDKASVQSKTLEELKALSLCGTAERIPLFSEVLAQVKGRVPLIIELKSGKHDKQLCQKTYALLCAYKGEVCIESFDPRIVGWFKKHAPDMLRGQLSARPRSFKKALSPVMAFMAGHCLMNFISRPQFIAYEIGRRPLTVRLANAMGAMNIGWTSHDAKSEKGRDAVIFEFYTPETKFK